MGYLKKVRAKHVSPWSLLLKYTVKLSSITYKNLQTMYKEILLTPLFAFVP
jgi:hypothetical protein